MQLDLDEAQQRADAGRGRANPNSAHARHGRAHTRCAARSADGCGPTGSWCSPVSSSSPWRISKNRSRPRADWQARSRKLIAAWSAVASWATEKLQKVALADARSRRATAQPLRPATEAAAASTIAMMVSMLALCIASFVRRMCPPAMWPVSCAMTPISWFGFSARSISPVLIKIAWPPATNELIWSSSIR